MIRCISLRLLLEVLYYKIILFSELRDALSLSEQTKTNLESELRIYEKNLTELNEKFSRAEEKINQLSNQKEKLVSIRIYAGIYLLNIQ